MMDRHIKAPLNDDEVKMLKAGDYVYISGTIYTARDAAHKRMYEALQNGQEVPMPLKNNIVYYMGPSPAREGRPIGSAGPTTSSRMDKYAPLLMDQGLKGMIGKGKRSDEVPEAGGPESAVDAKLRRAESGSGIYDSADRHPWNGSIFYAV